MNIHLLKEVGRLKKRILELSNMVELAVRSSVAAIIQHDTELARQVIKNDLEIDHKELEIEEECLKILALYQPLAGDLRYVIACLKVNNDLERIGDLAANIAKCAITIAEYPTAELQLDFKPMMDITRGMLKDTLDALIHNDEALALKVLKKDDEVDQYNSKMLKKLEAMITEQPDKAPYFIKLMSVSKHLERIADYATNISEDIVYMIRGEIIRHGGL
ncbi:MAG: phosphate signaling complex protein PhoU [Victivallaceae bacterium]|nr:phosphate signaling complex protein PhoU [Victivallaceae bacterium]